MTGSDQRSRTSDAVPSLARRRLLAGGVGAAGIALLAGCGEEEAAPGSGQATGTDLGPASSIEIGSGVVFTAEKVVVTQPTKGEFRAFDTTCTHAGCPVAAVTSTINCPCHGSQFSLEDGSAVTGPATEPLTPKAVAVEDGSLRVS